MAMAMGVELKTRAKRTSAARKSSAGSSPGARLSTSVREAPGNAVLAEGDAMQQPHRQALAVAPLQIDIELLGQHIARRTGDTSEQSRAAARDEIAELANRPSPPAPDRNRASSASVAFI